MTLEELADHIAQKYKIQGYHVWTDFRDTLVGLLRKHFQQLARDEILKLGMQDCPISDEDVTDVGFAIDHRLSRSKESVERIVQGLNWAFARIRVMSEDNGYMEGFEAGKKAGMEQFKERFRERLWKEGSRLTHGSYVDGVRFAINELEKMKLED